MDEPTNTAPDATTPEMEAAKKAALMQEGATTEATPMEEGAPEATLAPETTPEA